MTDEDAEHAAAPVEHPVAEAPSAHEEARKARSVDEDADDPTFAWQFTDPDTDTQYDSTTFRLRRLGGQESRRLQDKHTKKTWRSHQRHVEIDRDAFFDDALDHCIVSWEGVQDAQSGAELPCTRELKLRLPVALHLEIARVCFGGGPSRRHGG